MDPYVVKGDRILPNPEQWHYVKVPALVLTRGNCDIIAPGYEMLSNLNPSQTRVFVHELQLRQFAGAFLWPMLTQALPRTPVYVVTDINQQQGIQFKLLTTSDTWEGDRIALAENFRPATDNFFSNSRDYDSTSAQQFAAEYGLGQMDAINPDSGIMHEDTTTEEDAAALAARQTQTYESGNPIVRPLADGYVELAMNGGPLAALIRAGEPRAGTERPSEENLAATLSYELNLFALKTTPQKLPTWFVRGLGSLLGSTRVHRKLIQFARTRPAFVGLHMPKLSELLQNNGAFRVEDTQMAALFVHYGLFGDNGKYTTRFMQFVEKLGNNEKPTDAMFKEVFGISMGRMETYLATYGRAFGYYKSMDFKGEIPPMPAPTYREAAQSEVARIKGEMYISQANPAKALEELRTAYWRGERDPAMLALLASVEQQIGSEDRARKITKTLLELPKPPPRAYIVAARLQFKDALAAKPADAKLTADETSSLIATLGGALAGGLTTEELCDTLAEVVLKSAGAPDANTAGFLGEAAKRYPLNQSIAAALKANGGQTSEPSNN